MQKIASIEMQEGNTLSSRRGSAEKFPDLGTAGDETLLVDKLLKDDKKPSSTPMETKEDNGNAFVAYKQLWSYATNLDIALRIVGAIAACAAGTALPLMTLVFGQLVNTFNGWAAGTVTPVELRTAVNHFSLYFVYLFIAKFCTVYIHTTCFTLSATRATRNIRHSFIKALLRQDISYFDNCSPGSIATLISNNADTIQTGLGEKVGVTIQGVSMLISAFVVAFVSGWKLTLVTATTLPAVVIAITITVILDGKLESKISDIYTKAAGLAEESLSSIRNVTALGANAKFQKRYNVYLDQAKGFGVKKGPILGVQYSIEYASMQCAYALCFFYGVRLFTQGEFQNGGQVITVLFAVLMGTSSMAHIAPSIGDFTEAGAAAVSVLALIAQEPKIDSAGTDGTQLGSDLQGHLTVNGITFAYPARPSMNVLNDVTMIFEAKKTTAIVGASGSGKSTLVALTERWYDPASGSIQLDGQDIKSINVRSLRSQIGLVQQEPVLFNDSIYNNVVHGLYGTSMDSLPEAEKRKLVQEACMEANAAGFIEELPEKYETKVGERGGALSGGQKQRLAIARSIIKNPKILLLDEATSALDPTAEGIVQAALDKVSRTRTTILIAHKLSTVKKADKIIVLNKGTLVEQGTHESLLSAKGAYFKLVAAQNLNTANEKVDIQNMKIRDDEQERNNELAMTKAGRSIATIRHQVEQQDVSRKLSLLRCLSIILYERRSLWALFLAGLFCSALGAAVFPAQAIIFSRAVLVFRFTGAKLVSEANFWALMFFVLGIATFLSYAGVGFFLTIAAFLTTRVYRSEYYAAMLRQDIEFHDTEGNSSGALTSNLGTDPANIQETISSNLCLILIAIITLLSTCTLALVAGWKLALVTIFGCLPALLFAGFAGTRLEEQSQDRNAKIYAESARFAAEAVGSIRTVSSLTLEGKVAKTYGDMLDVSVNRAYKHIAISMFLFGLAESLDLLAMGLAFWYGGTLLSKQEYSATTFFVIFIAIIYGGQAAGLCFGFSSNTTKFHSGANHVLHLRNQKPPINSSTGISPKTTIKSAATNEIAIEFSNVHFSYPTRPEVPVLRGLDLKILQGQSIGIVGASGCGKTTIIALLERFYDIHKGHIHINSQHLQSLDVHLHRETIGLVGQDTTLYEGTIRDNVLLGVKEEIEHSTPEQELQEKVEIACKSADIHDFILSLPEGYSTPCGSRGLALSGGQRQRIAIARALIREPSILLLDEATSALDTQSEEVVQRALEQAGRGRTTVAVAHRLSTVKNCDKIFVLVKGLVREQGTHTELIAMRGVYWEMVQGQGLDVVVGN